MRKLYAVTWFDTVTGKYVRWFFTKPDLATHFASTLTEHAFNTDIQAFYIPTHAPLT